MGNPHPATHDKLWRFIELFAISGIAFAQPAFQVLNSNTLLLTYRDLSGVEFVVLGVMIALAPAAAAWVIVTAIHNFAERLAGIVHACIIGAWVAVLAVQAAKHGLSWHLDAALPIGVAAGAGATAAVLRWRMCRQWLHWLAIAPLFASTMFLVSSPTSAVAYGENRGGKPMKGTAAKRVVMIVLDELPVSSLIDPASPGQIDTKLFPNLAALANSSTWYRNTSTVSPFTDGAVPAILTGKYPTKESTPARVANHPNNLFTALGPQFKMHVHESVTDLCPIRLCTTAGAGGSSATSRLQKITRDTWTLWKQFTNPDAPPPIPDFTGVLALDNDPLTTGQRFASQIQRSRAKHLDFLHVFLPHLPWRYLPSGKQVLDTGTPPGLVANQWASDWAGLTGLQRHLLQLQAVDTMLGSVVQRLTIAQQWDDALVVITADHGVAFNGSEPLRGLSNRNASNIAFVPLFIKYPNQQQGEIDDRAVELIDIFPTIAAVLGTQPPEPVNGKSLLQAPVESRPIRIQDWELSKQRPNGNDGFVILPRPELFAQAMNGRAALTGSSLYAIGDYGALLGSEVVSTTAFAPGSITIDDKQKFETVQRTDTVSPWLDIRGSSLGIAPGTSLGITNNGRLAGLARTDRDGNWWAMMNPTSFVDGRNIVEIFVISGDVQSPRIQRITSPQR